MKLILVRHGQTDANASEIIQSFEDNKLNKTGVEQAKGVGRKLKEKYKIDSVFCSPILRAVETLNNILEEYPIEGEIFMCKLLEERNYGEYSGTEERMINWEELDKDSKINQEMGVESLESLQKRVELFLEDLKLEDENSTVLVVSHWGPLTIIVSKLTGVNVDELDIKNGEIVELDYDTKLKF